MTSSMHGLTDKSEPNEQLKQSQPDAQHKSPDIGSIQPGIAVPSAAYMMPHNPIAMGHIMAQAAYPIMDPYYRGMVAAFGGQTAIHPNLTGLPHAAVPLPSDAVEEPIYVNAKQYHGILRRRQSRAKAESENRSIKSRKPYLHESRHLHALKRARGCGGRFLNTKTTDDQQNPVPSQDPTLPSENSCSANQQTGASSNDKTKDAKAPQFTASYQ